MGEARHPDFAHWLRRVMKLSSIDNEQLAEKLGVSQSTVYAWVNGRNIPKRRYVDGICAVLDTDRRKYAQMGGFDGRG